MLYADTAAGSVLCDDCQKKIGYTKGKRELPNYLIVDYALGELYLITDQTGLSNVAIGDYMVFQFIEDDIIKVIVVYIPEKSLAKKSHYCGIL